MVVTCFSSYYEKFADGTVQCIDDEIPFELPVGWVWCRLNHIANIQSSKRVFEKDYVSNGIPFFRSKEIGDLSRNEIIHTKLYISKELYEDLKVKYGVPQVGDILLTSVGSIGNYWICDGREFYYKDGNITQICSNVFFDSTYLTLFLGSPFFFQQITSSVSGTAYNALTIIKLKSLFFPLPPLQEQHRIVEKIQEILPAVEQYDNAQSKLDCLNNNIKELLKKSILQEAIQGCLVPQDPNDEPASILLQRIKEVKLRLLKEGKLKKKDVSDSTIYRGDDNRYYEKKGKENIDITEEIPFEIPESWEWCRMGTIGIWGAGSTPAKGNPNYYGGNILWLRTGELNNSVVYDTEIKITQKALEDCSLRMNKIGDVMIAMYGATIGKVAIAGAEMTTNQACCACTPIGIFNWYLFYFLMASQQDFIKKGEGGAQPNISREKLISHMIPIPPLAEQRRIVETLKILLNKIKGN